VGHSQAEKARSRERILDAAARQIRASGIDSLSIADLMKAAELTHGGFYGHFKSRAALIEAAVERAMDVGTASFTAVDSASRRGPVKSLVNTYLSPVNRDDRDHGCPFAALANDVGRGDDPAVRKLMAERLEQMFVSMKSRLGDGPGSEPAALAAWSTMVGAITLARLFDGPRSDQILKAARQSILDLAAGLEGQDGEAENR